MWTEEWKWKRRGRRWYGSIDLDAWPQSDTLLIRLSWTRVVAKWPCLHFPWPGPFCYRAHNGRHSSGSKGGSTDAYLQYDAEIASHLWPSSHCSPISLEVILYVHYQDVLPFDCHLHYYNSPVHTFLASLLHPHPFFFCCCSILDINTSFAHLDICFYPPSILLVMDRFVQRPCLWTVFYGPYKSPTVSTACCPFLQNAHISFRLHY